VRDVKIDGELATILPQMMRLSPCYLIPRPEIGYIIWAIRQSSSFRITRLLKACHSVARWSIPRIWQMGHILWFVLLVSCILCLVQSLLHLQYCSRISFCVTRHCGRKLWRRTLQAPPVGYGHSCVKNQVNERHWPSNPTYVVNVFKDTPMKEV